MRSAPLSTDLRKQYTFSARSNAAKEIATWGRDFGSLAEPGMRSVGQLSDNVTEARMLQTKVMDMSKERYKYILQAEFTKKAFLDSQKRKTKLMPGLLQGIDVDAWLSKRRPVGSTQSAHSTGNARWAFLNRMEAMGEKCRDFEEENPFAMPERPKVPEKVVPEFYRIRLKELEEEKDKMFPTQPLLTQKSVKFCKEVDKSDLRLTLTLKTRMGDESAPVFTQRSQQEAPHLKERDSRVQSSASHRSVQDTRYQGLHSALSAPYHGVAQQDVKHIIDTIEALHAPTKALSSRRKPKLKKQILEYLRERNLID